LNGGGDARSWRQAVRCVDLRRVEPLEEHRVLPGDPLATRSARITDEWILRVVRAPEAESIQEDGRIRRWGGIAEAEGRHSRVVLLPDGETVHNAFFDRRFKP
jgi:hypothetical protein